MVGLFTLLLLAAVAGIIRPYVKGSRRWHFALAAVAALVAIGLVAPKPDNRTRTEALASSPTAVPAKPFLTIAPRALDAHRVELVIGTNMPTPIKVAASIDLAGMKDTDTYVGYQEFVTLTGATTTVVLDTAKADKSLPRSEYDATVTFYPKWGAEGNPAAAGAPQLHAEKRFTLQAGGGSVADTKERDGGRRWVMENVVAGTTWDRASFERRLGRAETGPSDLNMHAAYFYPAVGMTMLVNRTTGRIATWRDGNAILPPNASRADFASRGLTWPLTVDRGWLGCTGDAVWFMVADGKIYGVNGAASRYLKIDPIWSEDRKTMDDLRAAGANGGPTIRINIGDLIGEGRKLCN